MLKDEWKTRLNNTLTGTLRVSTSWGAVGTVRLNQAEDFIVAWDDGNETLYGNIDHLSIYGCDEVEPSEMGKPKLGKSMSSISNRLREIELALEEMTARRLFIPTSVIAEHNSLIGDLYGKKPE